jgi:hypothetical protein
LSDSSIGGAEYFSADHTVNHKLVIHIILMKDKLTPVTRLGPCFLKLLLVLTNQYTVKSADGPSP